MHHSLYLSPSRCSTHVPSNRGALRSSPRHVAKPLPRAAEGLKVNVFDKLKQIFTGSKPDEQDGAQPPADPTTGTLRRLDPDVTGSLDGSGSDTFGPLAVLLVGFLVDELERFRKVMNDMDADIVKIIPCTRDLMKCTLQEALDSTYPRYEEPPLGQRRMVIMSGMHAAEVMEVISAYKDSGLPPTVFAAAVPNNYQRVVGELVSEVIQDHSNMQKRKQEGNL